MYCLPLSVVYDSKIRLTHIAVRHSERLDIVFRFTCKKDKQILVKFLLLTRYLQKLKHNVSANMTNINNGFPNCVKRNTSKTSTINYLNNVSIFIMHNTYMFRPYILAIFRELQVWPKHVGFAYNTHKNTVQIVVGEICVYYTVVWKMYNIRYDGSSFLIAT